MGATPEALLERYLVGDDEDAMEGLVRATRPRLLRAARRICAGEAEDAVQAAYLELVKKGRAALGLPVLPWLMTVVVRGSYRRRARRAREHDLAARLAAPREGGPAPVRGAIGREEAELLRREVWRLPERYRDPLVLHYLHGLTLPEAARLLDLNESTLRTRVQRGRTLLRSRLARVLYPLVALPWLLADAAGATVPALGGVMKTKVALVGVAILVLASLAAFEFSRRESAPARPRAQLDPRTAPPLSVGATEAPDACGPETAAPAYAAGVVVDTAGRPVPGVRVIARAILPDEKAKLKLEAIAAKRGKTPPPRAHLRPQPIDDGLRAAAPLARTDAAGAFRIGADPGELHSLLFVKEGYAIRGVTTPADDLRVVLDPAYALAGVVTDTAGRPIRHARIHATHADATAWQVTRTGADGRYTFHSLATGVTRVRVSVRGYERAETAAPGHVADFRIARAWLLVDVTDAGSGEPLATANALLLAPDGRPFAHLLHRGHRTPGADPSDPPGRIVVGPDPAPLLAETDTVSAAVTVFAPGYRPAREPIVFRRGEEPPHLSVALHRGDGEASLAGRVVGATDAHVEVRDAQSLGREDYVLVTEADADRDGRFLFSGLPSAAYLVVVTAPGAGKVTREVKAPARDLVIELAPGAQLEVLTGRPGTPVHAQQADGNRFWNAEADADGRAFFAHLPAAPVRVRSTVTRQTRPLDGRSGRVVELRAGTTARIELAAPARKPFRLAVRDQHGAFRAGIAVQFEPRGGPAVTGGKIEWLRLRGLGLSTDVDGTVSTDLYPGSYEVVISGVRVGRVDVGPTGPVGEIVAPAHGTVVRGQVLEFGTGRPLRDMLVTLHVRGRRGGQAADTRTDDDGRFEVRDLPRGDVWVGCGDHGGLAMWSSAGARIDLAATPERDVVLVLVPLLGDSVPPRPVTLDVETTELARVIAWARLRDGWTRIGTRQTDEAGRTSLEVIGADRYRVDASTPDGKRGSRTFARAGHRIAVFLDFEPGK